MPREKCTIYNPLLGCCYIIENLKTKEKVVGRVLGPNDIEKYGIVRSPRKCNRGEEFFKVLIGDVVYTMMNSLKYTDCLSSCGTYKFTNIKPSKCEVNKIKKDKKPRVKRKDLIPNPSAEVEFISPDMLETII